MSLELWFAFVVAASILLWIPGPTILLVVSYALTRGRHTALSTTMGAVLGDLVAMTLSLLGVGALLAASAELFMVMKWLGAAYLVYLGIRMWRAQPTEPNVAAVPNGRAARSAFGHAFAVTLLNPKSILFFIAFLPQFVSPAAPALPQMVILGATFLGLAFLACFSYGLFAGSLRESVGSPARQRLVNRVGGSALIGAGVFAAAMKRSS